MKTIKGILFGFSHVQSKKKDSSQEILSRSWIFSAKRMCEDCKQPISKLYPMLEILSDYLCFTFLFTKKFGIMQLGYGNSDCSSIGYFCSYMCMISRRWNYMSTSNCGNTAVITRTVFLPLSVIMARLFICLCFGVEHVWDFLCSNGMLNDRYNKVAWRIRRRWCYDRIFDWTLSHPLGFLSYRFWWA